MDRRFAVVEDFADHGAMTRLISLSVLLVTGLALALTACAGSPETTEPAPQTLTLASLGATGGARIDAHDRPEPPIGFTESEMDALARLLADIATRSFSRHNLERIGVKNKLEHVLRPLKSSYPDAVTAFLEGAHEKYSPRPWRRILVDPFAPRSTPPKPAEILKVVWDVQSGQYSGDRYVVLQLQIHAAYEVGTTTSPRLIGIRRMIELLSYGDDYVPSLGGGSVAYGTDGCVEAIDGRYQPTTDPKTIDNDMRELKKSLAAKGIVDDGSGSRTSLEKTIKACKSP